MLEHHESRNVVVGFALLFLLSLLAALGLRLLGASTFGGGWDGIRLGGACVSLSGGCVGLCGSYVGLRGGGIIFGGRRSRGSCRFAKEGAKFGDSRLVTCPVLVVESMDFLV